jgi:hypothetical protein
MSNGLPVLLFTDGFIEILWFYLGLVLVGAIVFMGVFFFVICPL